MSNKTVMKKLTLNRETLVALDRADLGEINGGTSPTIAVSVASLRFCQYTPRVIGATVTVGKAINWLSQHHGPSDAKHIGRVGIPRNR